MKAFSNEIRIAIETTLAIYKANPEYTLKNEETGFTAELLLDHVTDHIITEFENHIRFLTGQSIVNWDVIPESEDKVKLVIRITNGWEPVNIRTDRSPSNKKTKR